MRTKPRPRFHPSSDAECPSSERQVPPRTIAFYKPFDVLSQFTPEEPGQRTLAEFGLPEGLYPAGRLDRDSEGLLLLSNDGPFIKRLLDPARGHPRTYWVQVENVPTPEALNRLRQGVEIRVGKGLYQTLPAKVTLLDAPPTLPPRDPPIRYRAAIPTAWLEITLTEGKNRQVRKMTASAGFPTLRLVRVRIGAVSLADLAPGQWRWIEASDALKLR